jgi:hypothetical protein
VLVKNPNLDFVPKPLKKDEPKKEEKPHTHPSGFKHDDELEKDVDLIRPVIEPTRFDRSSFASKLEWEIYLA